MRWAILAFAFIAMHEMCVAEITSVSRLDDDGSDVLEEIFTEAFMMAPEVTDGSIIFVQCDKGSWVSPSHTFGDIMAKFPGGPFRGKNGLDLVSW